MLRVKGIYHDQTITLLEPLALPKNTTVDVIIAEPESEPEQLYRQQARKLGLIKEHPTLLIEVSPYTPIEVNGQPLSETIIEERR